MTFTVEDGTVVTGANSYTSVADADTYHTDRGSAAWDDLTEAQKQTALVKATDYIEQNYMNRWRGVLVEASQPLEWPRANVLGEYTSTYSPALYPYDYTIPENLKQAVCILALESLTEDLNPIQGQTIKREKVDVIEVEYMDAVSGGRTSRSRPAIDGMLRKFISGSGLNARTVRV